MEEENPIDLVELLESQDKIPVKSRTNLPNYNIEGDSGYGESSYDSNFYPDAEINIGREGLDMVSLINEKRSIKQPWAAKAGAGVLRAGSKALQEISKMPGVLGGIAAGTVGQIGDAITGEDNTDFIKTAFDNQWVKTVNEIGETINKEALPVYVSKAVSEGNLWDNITAIDFWATEGADGLGYIISMLAPGAAINKLGVGSKIIKGLSKSGKFKDSTVRAAEKLGELGLPTTAKNIDLYSQTIANTLFEAGAEAQGAMESYKHSLDAKLQSGEMTQAEYDIQLGKQSEVGRNVFLTNAAILVGPNAIMSKMLWGKAAQKASGKLLNKGGELTKLENPSFLRKVKLYGDDFGKATLREGFFEEGLQSTAETYFTKNADSNLLDFIGDLPKAYTEMLGTTEGQKAILLGGVFGGGMQAYTGGKTRAKNIKTTNKLIELGNTALSDMYNVFNEDVYQKDDNGEIIYENDKPVYDYKKVQDKLKSQDSLEGLSAMYDIAIENNDTQTIEQIKDLVSTNLVKPFIVNDELGIDVLKQHLELSKDIEAISEREKKDKDTYINDIIKKAEKLQVDYNSFQNFSNDLINLEGGTKAQKVDYYNKLSMQYLDSKSREYYLTDKLKQSKETYNELVQSKGIDLGILENNGALKNELENDSRIKKVSNDIKNLESSIEEVKATNDAFWDGKSVQEAYSKEIQDAEAINEEVEKKAEEVDDQFNKIKEAKTKDELDLIQSTNPIILAEIEKKRQLIENKEKEAKEKVKEDNKEFENTQNVAKEEANLDFDYVSNNFNEEEVIKLPNSLGGQDVTITEINPTSIVVEDSNGEIRTITKNQFDDRNPSSEYNIEGVEFTLQSSDTNQKNDPFKDGDTGVLSVDSEGNKLSFIDQAVVDFERTPRNKVGQSVGFKINDTTTGLSDNQKKARSMVEANDFSDKEFLVNHLPINVKLTDDVSAPIETISENSSNYNDVFNKTTKVMRKAIVEELAAGNKIEDITSEISGQWNGELQLEEEVLENSLLDLYEIAGDIKKLKSDNLYVVDDNGILKNTKGDILNTRNRQSPGEIYLKIHMANGKPFPLKLNVKRINEDEASLLYELYKYRFEDISEGKATRIVDTNPDVLEKIKEVFAEELELFTSNKTPLQDITIKDVVDFIIWDGSKSPKSQVRFLKGKLLVAGESYTAEDFASDNAKEDFINTLTTNKRHNIAFKRRPGQDFNSLNFQNRSYIEYIVNKGILNTNAKVNEPTFAGMTKMYLAIDKVKVKGEMSKHNTVFKPRPKPETKPIPPTKKTAKTTSEPSVGVNMGNKIDYAKLGIPAPTPAPTPSKKVAPATPEPTVDSSMPAMSMNVLSKLGVPTPKAKAPSAPKPAPKPKRVESNNQDVVKQTQASFTDNNLLATGEPLTINKIQYVMTKDYYIVDMTNKKAVTDIKTVLAYVDAYNKVTKLKSWKLDKNKVEKIWNSRLKVVPLQDTVKKEEMTDAEVTNTIRSLIMAYPSYMKEITGLMDKNKNKSMGDKLQLIFTLLKSKNISQEEINTKCK